MMVQIEDQKGYNWKEANMTKQEEHFNENTFKWFVDESVTVEQYNKYQECAKMLIGSKENLEHYYDNENEYYNELLNLLKCDKNLLREYVRNCSIGLDHIVKYYKVAGKLPSQEEITILHDALARGVDLIEIGMIIKEE